MREWDQHGQMTGAVVVADDMDSSDAQVLLKSLCENNFSDLPRIAQNACGGFLAAGISADGAIHLVRDGAGLRSVSYAWNGTNWLWAK